MDILLTGCDGFIGKHLNTYLSTKYKVIGLDAKSGNNLLVCDLNYNVDLVIHLAARSGIKDSLNNPTDYWKNNLKNLVFKHYTETKSKISENLYNNFDNEINNFVQICPKEMLDKLENPISNKKITGVAS